MGHIFFVVLFVVVFNNPVERVISSRD